jgi:hypothetical protein
MLKSFLSTRADNENKGNWIIKSDPSPPSEPNVLARLPGNLSKSSFHILTMPDGVYSSNSKASLKVKIFSGDKDQAAGLIVRFQDENHYFVLVADALHQRFSLCRAEPERLLCTEDKDAVVTPGQWHTIAAQVSAQGIAGYLDNNLLLQRYDQHYISGEIGLWTKGNTDAYFDNLEIDY